jgi:protease-4
MFKIFGKEEDKEVLEKKKAKWDLRSSKIKTYMFIVAIVAEIGIFYYMAKAYGLVEESVASGDKIAVIDFKEQVTQTYVNKIIKSMEKVKKNKEYEEVLFIMNSPGGSPTASEELSEYLKAYNKSKHITMYIQGIAASGGYYIASAIKPLYSNKNAIVGSIGVIMPHFNIGKLADKIGIEEDDLSAGKFKKPISMFKKIEGEDKEYLKKQILTPMYNNFLKSVADNRELNVSEVLPYAEGKIYMANSKEIDGILVDEIVVLSTLKQRIRDEKKHKITFVNVMPKTPMGIFGNGKVELNLNLADIVSPNFK